MKKFFKYFAIVIFATLFTLYAEFLFALPRFIDLDCYKEDIQKIVTEQTKMSLDFNNARLITTPLLGAGIKADNISLNLPDGSLLFHTNSFKAKVSLPSLFLLTVKVSEVEIDNPQINLDIVNDEQFKIVRVIEDILNTQKRIAAEKPPIETSSSFQFDPSWIKIKVVNFNINDYIVLVNDLKSGHKLALKGDKIALEYNNGKTFKVKTDARLMSDENENINAKISINSFIPPAVKLDEEDDPAERVELPFVNPVTVYRDYDLKANVNTKLKIRMKDNALRMRGFVNINDITMNLSGLQLPYSNFNAIFTGKSVKTNSDIYIADKENFKIKGIIGYGKKPFINLNMTSQKILFNDVIKLSKAFLDTLHIKNDLKDVHANGYFTANTNIKTNFKKMKSDGAIIVRDGDISYKTAGLILKDINSNFIFENNMLNIKDTYININGALIKTEGKIDKNANADITVKTENLPLHGLFAAFAPSDIKKSFSLDNALLSLNAAIHGRLNNPNAYLDLGIRDVVFRDVNNNFIINNDKLSVNFNKDSESYLGSVVNSKFNLQIPATKSTLSNPVLSVRIDPENITLDTSVLKLNNISAVNFEGKITEYLKRPLVDFKADGYLKAADLKQLAGDMAAPFIKANGEIPFKLSLKGNDKRQNLISQIYADANNNITPVDIKNVVGKPSVIQTKIDFKKNRIKIKETGMYIKAFAGFGDDFDENMSNTKEIAGISGTIVNLDTPEPFINLIKFNIPKDLEISLCGLKNSALTAGGHLSVFGKSASPRTRGKFNIKNVSIPDLFLTLDNADIDFRGKTLSFALNQLLLNNSDLKINGNIDLNPSSVIRIFDLNIFSNLTDVEKLMKVSDAAMKLVPASPSTQTASNQADIPVNIRSGHFNLKTINVPPLTLKNTTGNIGLAKNILNIDNINTTAIDDGHVRGNVLVNLLNTNVRARLRGNNFDVEKSLLVLANMKDALSGTLDFETDITIDGAAPDYNAQMKSLGGEVTFNIKEGQLGPFGKIENLILAENIRESEFFKTTIGGIINSITSIQTSHFNLMQGHLDFKNGIANLTPINTKGDVMCLNIEGNMNLLTNTADIRLRGKLGSQVSNMLGPLAAVNPINLVKVTPGLNVMAAKAFQFFCEQVSQAEMDAIPDFDKDFNSMSTTKFQVILRGDVAKPLSLIKSFKWLALDSDIENAENFVAALPDPSIVDDPANATYEQIMQAQELKAKEDAKLKNRLIRFFRRKKDK